MAGAPLLIAVKAAPPPVTRGHPVWRRLLITGTVLFLTIFIVLPVVNVFTQALSKGVTAYTEVLTGPAADQPPRNLAEKRKLATRRAQSEKTASAIRMSFGVAAVVVPLNILFGLMAAWAVTKFRFRGRLLLIALIDLPFSVSPVVAGLVFVLLFGRTGLFGAWATTFVWPDPASIAWRGFGAGWPIGFDRFNSGIIFTAARHRPGLGLRHLPVRGAVCDPAHAGARHR